MSVGGEAFGIDRQHVASDESDRFETYYLAHYVWLSSLLARAIPNPADVEDVCAEVFELALRKRAHLGDYALGQQRKWLYEASSRAMSKRARRWARHQAALERAFHESVTHGGDPLDDLVSDEERDALAERDAHVRSVLNEMKDEHRAVLEFRAAGLKGPAVAERLGVSHQLARTRLMHARREFSSRWSARHRSGASESERP